MLWPFSGKLHSVRSSQVLLQTGGVSSSVHIAISLIGTCKHGRVIDISIMGERSILPIFKMHLRVSALAIFRETPLSCCTHGYYKLVEYQLLYTFVHHLPGPVNMVKISIFSLYFTVFLYYGGCRFVLWEVKTHSLTKVCLCNSWITCSRALLRVCATSRAARFWPDPT